MSEVQEQQRNSKYENREKLNRTPEIKGVINEVQINGLMDQEVRSQSRGSFGRHSVKSAGGETEYKYISSSIQEQQQKNKRREESVPDKRQEFSFSKRERMERNEKNEKLKTQQNSPMDTRSRSPLRKMLFNATEGRKPVDQNMQIIKMEQTQDSPMKLDKNKENVNHVSFQLDTELDESLSKYNMSEQEIKQVKSKYGWVGNKRAQKSNSNLHTPPRYSKETQKVTEEIISPIKPESPQKQQSSHASQYVRSSSQLNNTQGSVSISNQKDDYMFNNAQNYRTIDTRDSRIQDKIVNKMLESTFEKNRYSNLKSYQVPEMSPSDHGRQRYAQDQQPPQRNQMPMDQSQRSHKPETQHHRSYASDVPPQRNYIPEPQRSYNLEAQQQRGYMPDTQPHRGYMPESQPQRSYMPESQPQRGYMPDSQPQRAHTPDSQPQRSHTPDTVPQRTYMPEAANQRTPTREYKPNAANITPKRNITPQRDSEPYHQPYQNQSLHREPSNMTFHQRDRDYVPPQRNYKHEYYQDLVPKREYAPAPQHHRDYSRGSESRPSYHNKLSQFLTIPQEPVEQKRVSAASQSFDEWKFSCQMEMKRDGGLLTSDHSTSSSMQYQQRPSSSNMQQSPLRNGGQYIRKTFDYKEPKPSTPRSRSANQGEQFKNNLGTKSCTQVAQYPAFDFVEILERTRATQQELHSLHLLKPNNPVYMNFGKYQSTVNQEQIQSMPPMAQQLVSELSLQHEWMAKNVIMLMNQLCQERLANGQIK